MPRPGKVRPSATAASDTTLSLLQKDDLVARELQIVRQKTEGDEVERLEQGGLHARQAWRQRNDDPLPLHGLEHVVDELAQGPGLGAAELVGASRGDGPVDGARDRLRHVARIDRLETGVGAGQRQDRQHAG